MRFFYSPVANKYVAQVIKPNGDVWRIEYTDATRGEAMRTCGRWAGSPEMRGYSWWDAAVMCNQIRKSVECLGK